MGWLSGLISLGLVVHIHKFFFISVFVIVLYSFKMLQEICKDNSLSRFYSMELGFIWICYVIWDQQCIFVKWENVVQLYRKYVCVTLDLLVLIPELLIYRSLFCVIFGRYMLYFVCWYVICKYQNNWVWGCYVTCRRPCGIIQWFKLWN